MNPRVENGWVVVDCDAPDTTRVSLAIGKTPVDFVPAFRDYSQGARVAKAMIELGSGRHMVHIKVGAVTKLAGVLIV